MVSVEVDSPKLGSTLSIQIATEKEGPIVFVGHTRGLRRVGSGYLQDHFWLKGSPTTIKKINLRTDTHTTETKTLLLHGLE